MKKKELISLLNTLSRLNKKKTDSLFHAQHAKVFREFNCLSCANCCKILGPRLNSSDIKRIAKALKISETKVIDTYLIIDEDHDYVFKSMPCPFLDEKNYCQIYYNRPKACREYPHTHQKKIQSLLTVAQNNYDICPALRQILSGIKKSIQ